MGAEDNRIEDDFFTLFKSKICNCQNTEKSLMLIFENMVKNTNFLSLTNIGSLIFLNFYDCGLMRLDLSKI